MHLPRRSSIALGALLLAGCATIGSPPQETQAAASAVEQREAQAALQVIPPAKRLKQKIAIGRFSNETRYGRTFIRDEAGDPLGKQASDMLAARLVEAGAFPVFERPDLKQGARQQAHTGPGRVIRVHTLDLGFVPE